MAHPRGPAPTNAEILERSLADAKTFTGYASMPMNDWMLGVDGQLDTTFAVLGRADVASSGASIGVTPLTPAPPGAGTYRVSYYLAEIQADNVGSTVTVTFSWTDGGITRSLSGAALVLNSTAAAQTGTLLLVVDGGTPISYSTTYGTTGGAPPMLYKLAIRLEKVST